MSPLGVALLIIVVMLLAGGTPYGPFGYGYGYGHGGLLSTILVVLLILWLLRMV